MEGKTVSVCHCLAKIAGSAAWLQADRVQGQVFGFNFGFEVQSLCLGVQGLGWRIRVCLVNRKQPKVYFCRSRLGAWCFSFEFHVCCEDWRPKNF